MIQEYHKNVIELFTRAVQSNSQNDALLTHNSSMTFQALEHISNQWCNYIFDLCSIDEIDLSGHVSAVYIDRQLEQVISALVAFKLGMAYVPIDPAHPKKRILSVFQDCKPKIVFTTAQNRPKLESDIRLFDSLPLVIEIDDELLVEGMRTETLPANINPSDVAYIIYTSGSTGKPKGVEITHGSLANLVDFQIKLFNLRPGKKVLNFSSFIFDASVWETFSCLGSGAALYIPDKKSIIPGSDLIDTIVTNEITHLTMPPSVLAALPFANFPALECLVSAGEQCTNFIKQKWSGASYKFYNAYGPTESTVCVSITELKFSDDVIHLGEPIQNMKLMVLDSSFKPVLTGQTGELFISGKGLAKGYINDPESTNKVFFNISDPDTTHVDGKSMIRVYKTGDLATINDDGKILFLGRGDSQIKHNGFRIDLGEIEHVLCQSPGIANAVICYQNVDDRFEIVTYYLLDKGQKTTAKSVVTAHLKSHLPSYMLPNRLIEVDTFPLTDNLKIDRKKLRPENFVNLTDDRSSSLDKRLHNEVQEKLIEIFQEVLTVSSVGLEDDFFDIGGHSLLVVQVIMMIHDRCKVNINIADFFDSPTVLELSKLIDSLTSDETMGDITVEVQDKGELDRSHSDSAEFPLTEIQQAYYLGRSGYFELSNTSTNVYREFHFKMIDVDRLESAYNALIKHHEMLRCSFLSAHHQKILPEIPWVRIPLTDISSQSQSQQKAYIESIRKQMSIEKLDASKPPLLSAQVTFLGAHYCLHVVIDALIMDGWSYYRFFDDWNRAYKDENFYFSPLDVHYRDYVNALLEDFKTDNFKRSSDYWMARIPRLPFGPNLPLEIQPKEVINQAVKSLRYDFSSKCWSKLKKFISSNGLRDTSFLLSIFAEIVGLWSASNNFTLCLTLFNRHPIGKDINNLIGVFTTLLLLEVKLSSDSVLETISTLQEQLFSDIDHRYFSGVAVQKAHRNYHKYAAQGTMTPVVFTSFLSAPEPTDSDSLFSDENSHYSCTQTSQVWLDAKVYESSGKLTVEWDYIESIFPSGMIHDMFAAYCDAITLLSNDISNFTQPFSLASKVEDNDLSIAFADQWKSDFGTLISNFEITLGTYSTNNAVVSHDGSLTYEQLNNKSNALANYLLQNNVRKGSIVAIVLPPSIYQSISMLAVLKTGAAYLPIDPLQPEERLKYMIGNAGVEIVITFGDQADLLKSIDWAQETNTPNFVTVTDIDLEFDTSNLGTSIDSSDLAYVIYTSGSTGLPKGVMITHEAVINTLNDINTRYKIDSTDKILSVSNFSFDLSVYDYFGMFLAGGSVYTIKPGAGKDPGYWLELITSHKITIWNSVPMLANMLLKYYESHKRKISLESINLFLLSGDWVPLHLADELRNQYISPSNVRVVSLGGATECSIWSILHDIDKSDLNKKAIPYGSSMNGQKVEVLNKNLIPCPPYVRGEIFISGIGLSQGYINNPSQTDAHFIRNPISGELLYKTGDLGHYLANGEIAFLGREDGQVKIGGHRIELDEINYQLERIPSIESAHACIIKNGVSSLLVALYINNQHQSVSQTNSDELKMKMNSVLPEYMQPQYYFELDSFPLSSNGKIDAKMLLSIAREKYCEKVSSRCTTKINSNLLSIWKKVLDVEFISDSSDFFSLGGDSLKLIELMVEINKTFDLSVTIPELITNRTLMAQSKILSEANAKCGAVV